MHRTTRLQLTELNPHLLCVLCGGYLIDATTIIECLHSFCRTCIIRYLETSKFCPICDVQVHKTRPLSNIRSDKTLQDLVYRLVPGIFKDEMRRRREFYAAHPQSGPSSSSLNASEERGNVEDPSATYTPHEQISLCLQHCDRLPPFKAASLANGNRTQDRGSDRRHLLCPAAVTVGHLKKFVRLKFELAPHYNVEVFHSDESLKNDYTLLDVAYIYGWRRTEPLRLYYVVYDKANSAVSLPSLPTDVPLSSRPSSPVDAAPGQRKRTHTPTEEEQTPTVTAKRHRSETSAESEPASTSTLTSGVLPEQATSEASTSQSVMPESSSTSLSTVTLSEDKGHMSVSSDDDDDDEPLSVIKSRIHYSGSANKTNKDDGNSSDSKRTASPDAADASADSAARAPSAASGTSGCLTSVTSDRASIGTSVEATAVSAAQVAAAINNRNSTAPVHSSMPESGQPSVTAEHNRAAAKEVSLAPKTIASFIHANEIKAQKHAASTVDVPCARGSSVQQLTSSLLNRDADASGRPDKTTKVTVACPQRLSTSVSLPAKLCHTKTTKRATTNGSTAKREHASSTALKRLTASVASSYCKLATGKQQQQLAATAKSATKPQLASLKAAPPKPVGGLVKQTAATNPKSPAISPTEPGKAPVHRSPPNFEALVRNIGKKSPTQTSPPVSRTPSTSPSVARAQSVNGKLPNDASKRGASKFQTAPSRAGSVTPQPGLVKVTLGGAPTPAATTAMQTLGMSHAVPISYPAFPSSGILVINAGPTGQQIQQLLMQQQQLQKQQQQQQQQQQQSLHTQKKKPSLPGVSNRAGNGGSRRRSEPVIAPATPVACCSVPMSPLVTSPVTASPAVTSPVSSPVVSSPTVTSPGATSPAVTAPIVRVPVSSNVMTNGITTAIPTAITTANGGNKHVITTTANTSHAHHVTTNARAAIPASHSKANGNTHVTSAVNSSHAHADSDVTEEEEELPSNPLANGYDAPLELTTKKSRSREKERERERLKTVHKPQSNSDKTLLIVPSLIRT
ncbi:hypothetical protein NP493_59g05000 [Ridgeia piscesae]|uniref:RING-type domain-containing protein n=1 Tax=Ridgeia piscesae TaxID=27915 RepID=A0AAD9PAN3_RIDPI|nr:hypothetical protein NP493_59g05000 [Ridgeia piscesae]